MKTRTIIYVCLLMSLNVHAQDSKWSMGSSVSFVFWDNGIAGSADNHTQTSFSAEIGHDFSNWCRAGIRHLIIRDRPSYSDALFLNLSGIFVQIGYMPAHAKWQSYVETGFYYKNTLFIERFVPDTRLTSSENNYGFAWGVSGRRSVGERLHLGLGLNHYIPFARLSDTNVGILVTPKLELIYKLKH